MIERLHVTQDDHGYWMLVHQTGLGLSVLQWGAERVDVLLEDVWESDREYEVWYSQSMALKQRRIGADDYAEPKPRRARRPYTKHTTMMPIPEARP
jgi:hypothetical protein